MSSEPKSTCAYIAPGGGLPYERGGDVRRKFWIKPPKETNLGVALAFLTPKIVNKTN